MATNSVTPDSAPENEVSREDSLFQVANSASMALSDIKGICQLLIDHGGIFELDVPEEIGAAISMIQMRAEAMHREMGGVL